MSKQPNSAPNYQPQISQIPKTPFSTLYIDTIGPFPSSKNLKYKYVLTILCGYSRFLEAYPLKTLRASEIVNILYYQYILRHGNPEKISSDNASYFCSKTFQSFLQKMQIQHIRTSPFSPRSNLVERSHLEIGNMLKSLLSNTEQTSWPTFLPFICHANNSLQSTVTKLSPSMLAHKRDLHITGFTHYKDHLLDMEPTIAKLAADHGKIIDIYKNARLKHAKRLAEKYNQHIFAEGDLVKVKLHKKSKKSQNYSKKLDNRYAGPFAIIKKFSNTSFLLADSKGKQQSCHVLNLAPFHSNIDLTCNTPKSTDATTQTVNLSLPLCRINDPAQTTH